MSHLLLCLKSKCTDFLFNYLLDLPEITSYLLRSITLGKYTAVPTFLSLIIAALEVIFRKCDSVIGYSFLYGFRGSEMMTLQLQFQLREEVGL
jgi:hypothetical protein